MKQQPEPHSDLDPVLLERARNGDDKAYTEIVRKYEKLVYGFAFKICRNREYAEETLQDTFVNVFRKVGQFDGKSKFSTWLYSIVANNCLMKRRRTKLEQNIVRIDDPFTRQDGDGDESPGRTLTLPVWNETPLQETISKELRRHLDEAIQKLPVDYRLVFVLRDIEGQSAEDTAKILKLSVPAVKSRLRRARLFLREQLQEYMAS